MAQNLRLDIDQVAEIFYIVLESFASYSLEAEYLTNGPRREEEKGRQKHIEGESRWGHIRDATGLFCGQLAYWAQWIAIKTKSF